MVKPPLYNTLKHHKDKSPSLSFNKSMQKQNRKDQEINPRNNKQESCKLIQVNHWRNPDNVN